MTGPFTTDPLQQAMYEALDARLRTVLGDAPEVALLNFPDHGNPGDPALWLGAVRLLESQGRRIAYQCSPRSYDRGDLEAACPSGPILLNGGGNFGDLYRHQQDLREHVLATLKSRQVVQLPQSIHFTSRQRLDHARRLVAAHPRVTLMVREAQSHTIAGSFDAQVVLSPDTSVGLGPQERCSDARNPIVRVLRQASSPERTDLRAHPEHRDVHDLEWLASIGEDEAAWRGDLADALSTNRNWDPGNAWPSIASTFEPLATAWTRRGLDLLSRGRVVITDRLHGHLLCLLLNKPHVVLDTGYGKCRSTLETWTGTHPLVHCADDPDSALRLALDLVSDG